MVQAVTATAIGPVTASTGGGPEWLETVDQGLQTALSAWMGYEQIQKTKNAVGIGQLELAKTQTLENGAAMPVDTKPLSPGQQQSQAVLDKAAQALGMTGKGLLMLGGCLGVLWYINR
ncbi:hypothetical protein [Agarivorans sp. QJM3NY_25]|uniref:hypothetical protein n=1 Tax=Agarivorans sp. QJM3NY_25 TaxID=3421430 RepID=UPI003D7D0527